MGVHDNSVLRISFAQDDEEAERLKQERLAKYQEKKSAS